MITDTLHLHTNGAVTLPKEWRDQFPTKHFIAVITGDGLLIKPIVDVEYYEHSPAHFGLRFPMGIEAGRLSAMMKQADSRISSSAKIKKSSRRRYGQS